MAALLVGFWMLAGSAGNGGAAEPIRSGGAQEAGEPASVLRGRVLDGGGQPLAGIELRFPGRGSEPVEATSDTDGRFEAGGVVDPRAVQPAESGWSVLALDGGRRRFSGGFREFEVVLAPVGPLAVRVLDAAGQPREGVPVRVELAVGPAPDQPGRRGARGARPAQLTDARGRASFDDIWRERRLRVVLQLPDGPLDATREQRGELVLDPSPIGRPIVLPARGPRELLASLDVPLTVAGRVIDRAGEPQAGAGVLVAEVSPEAGRRGRLASTRTDRDGAFELELFGLTSSQVRVAAADLPLPLVPGGVARWASGLEIDTQRARGDRLEIVLGLRPTRSLEGRLVDLPPDLDPARLEVLAVPSPAAHALAPTLLHASARARLDGEQRFTLRGLPAGPYELVVLEDGGGPGRLVRRSGIVIAGSDVPSISLAPRPAAHLELRLASAGPGPQRLRVLYGAVLGATPRGGAVRASLAEASAARTTGWPTDLSPGFRGARRVVSGSTVTLWRSYEVPREDGTYALPPSEPGPHHLAIDAGSEGLLVLGPLELRAGKLELVLVPPPQGGVEGWVVGQGHDLLHVAAFDETDRRLPLRTRGGEIRDAVRAASSGAFELEPLPAGAVVLRAGTTEELAIGAAVAETRVEVPAGGRTRAFLDAR